MAENRKKRLKKRVLGLLLLLFLVLATVGAVLAPIVRRTLEEAGREPYRRAKARVGHKLPIFASAIRGSARYRPPWSLEWLPFDASVVLLEGDEVFVEDGYVTLQTGNNGLLALGRGSSVRVSRLDQTHAGFHLLQGSASLRLEGGGEGGVELETAHGRYVAERGFYSLSTGGQGDIIRVQEGEITMAGAGGGRTLSRADGTRAISATADAALGISSEAEAELNALSRNLMVSAIQSPVSATGPSEFAVRDQEERVRTAVELFMQGMADRDPAVLAVLANQATLQGLTLSPSMLGQRLNDFFTEHGAISTDAVPGSIRTSITSVTTPEGTVQLAPSGTATATGTSPTTGTAAAGPSVAGPASSGTTAGASQPAADASGTAAPAPSGTTAEGQTAAAPTGTTEATPSGTTAEGQLSAEPTGTTEAAPSGTTAEGQLSAEPTATTAPSGTTSTTSTPAPTTTTVAPAPTTTVSYVSTSSVFTNVVTATAVVDFTATLVATETIPVSPTTEVVTCDINAQKPIRMKLQFIQGEWRVVDVRMQN